jgi:hypothetical protein
MRLDLETPIAVICHDAGAANHILSWLRVDGRLDDVRAVMSGPAECLWKKTFPDVPLFQTIEMALHDAKSMISGTGWASNIEHEARRIAKGRGIPSVALIDHWVNYAERFIREGECIWPDEFWVVDKEALSIAQNTFPGLCIRLVSNVYLANQLQRVMPVPSLNPELLYVLEPIRTDWGRGEEGEFQALDYFVSKLPFLDLPTNIFIRLRPHPSERPDKYTAWLAKHPELQLILDDSSELLDAISRAKWVAGCESFAMVIALNAGRKVFCTLPPWAPACRLPFHEIENLH